MDEMRTGPQVLVYPIGVERHLKYEPYSKVKKKRRKRKLLYCDSGLGLGRGHKNPQASSALKNNRQAQVVPLLLFSESSLW